MQWSDSTLEMAPATPDALTLRSGQTATLEMPQIAALELRVLVVIASYGNGNDPYLLRLLEEYASMPSRVDVVVLSNIPRDLGAGVEVLVGLPAKDPWSLPFGHKQIMAGRLDKYDLFIYSEDDTLITQNNIDAFLKASSVLRDDQLPGFLRYETGSDGAISYPDVHLGYHWSTESVTTAANSTFAFFTNEHAAVFMLTRAQLARAIRSGGFLVPPHKGPYDLLVSAATDPYTQCGFTKLICLSDLDSFLIPHLPNKYVGKLGTDGSLFRRQVDALLSAVASDRVPSPLFASRQDEVPGLEKNYYEPVRRDLIAKIPESAHRILSIGCGWGATEEALANSGKEVVAIPLDLAIAACIDHSRVRIVHGGLSTALAQLAGETFDCLLLSDVLHRFDDPGNALSRCEPLLTEDAVVIVAVQNFSWAKALYRRFQSAGLSGLLPQRTRRSPRMVSRSSLRSWLIQAGLRIDDFLEVIPAKAEKACRWTFGFAGRFLASEFIVVASRKGRHSLHQTASAPLMTPRGHL